MSEYFVDGIWKCQLCEQAFTDEEWADLVPRWARLAPGTHLLLHEQCIQPYRVRERLLK